MAASKAARTMMNMKMPKRRRAHFDVRFEIIDLNNVPLVTGKVLVKWQHSHTAFGGTTKEGKIQDHKVTWGHKAESNAWISISRTGELQESHLQLNVIQVLSLGNDKTERVDLGVVKLNLSQFVNICETTKSEFCQRYLLQNSKINSTLKVSILMQQTTGDLSFKAPPLRRVQAFSGIAGILANEKEDIQDQGEAATQDRSLEANEQHDLYRKLLSARWAAISGHPSAEQCIEDIFAGGDGWSICPEAKRQPFPYSGPNGSPDADDTAGNVPSHPQLSPVSLLNGIPPFSYPDGIGLGMKVPLSQSRVSTATTAVEPPVLNGYQRSNNLLSPNGAKSPLQPPMNSFNNRESRAVPLANPAWLTIPDPGFSRHGLAAPVSPRSQDAFPTSPQVRSQSPLMPPHGPSFSHDRIGDVFGLAPLPLHNLPLDSGMVDDFAMCEEHSCWKVDPSKGPRGEIPEWAWTECKENPPSILVDPLEPRNRHFRPPSPIKIVERS